MGETELPDWIALDWGTTNVRAWALGRDGAVLATAQSSMGMGGLESHEFEAALLDLISAWLQPGRTLDVIACGMVGARQGWVEADYLALPTRPLVPDRFQPVAARDARINVSIIPGLMQASPPDVMRGEETQIAGFLADQPDFQGVVCMPGTHTKWVTVADGQILGFGSYMTGEIFALLEQNSVLRHSLAGEGWDDDAFQAALSDVLTDPNIAVSSLFSLRAGDLLNGTAASVSRARLSAYLIGAEVNAAASQWAHQDVALVGAPDLVKLYNSALVMKGCTPCLFSADELTLKGLFAAKALLINGET